MVWCITGLFLVLTIIFLAGKGSFLIAGYNTAGKKEKARYDEKKLCRVMGGCMGVITAALAVTAWLGEDAPDYLRYGFIFVVFADIFVTAVLGNTVCLRKSTGEKSLEERRKNQKAMWFSMGILAVLFLIVGILLTTGNIKVNLTEEVMEIQGSYWPDLELSWDKIQSVSCAEGIQAGSRTGGLGSLRLQEGRFQNEEFGSYTRYTYVKCKKYVVMETTGGILAVNQKTEEETEALYEKILAEFEKNTGK